MLGALRDSSEEPLGTFLFDQAFEAFVEELRFSFIPVSFAARLICSSRFKVVLMHMNLHKNAYLSSRSFSSIATKGAIFSGVNLD